MRQTAALRHRPRVLIFSASPGAGQVRAAPALQEAFRMYGGCSRGHADGTSHVSKIFQRIYEDADMAMVQSAPGRIGRLYDGTDEPWSNARRRFALDRLHAQPMILDARAGASGPVHGDAFAAEILAWLIAKRKLRACYV